MTHRPSRSISDGRAHAHRYVFGLSGRSPAAAPALGRRERAVLGLELGERRLQVGDDRVGELLLAGQARRGPRACWSRTNGGTPPPSARLP